MAFAGETETLRGRPPSSAVPKFPGVWTDKVGVPLWLLCRERKTTSSAFGKVSGRVCALTASSLSVTNVDLFAAYFCAVNRVLLKSLVCLGKGKLLENVFGYVYACDVAC